MGERVLLVLLLCFSISLSSIRSNLVFASSENWSEVARFTDEGMIFTTDLFTIDHVEWRIRWEYEPQPEVPEEHPSLQFYVYNQESQGQWFESVSKRGTAEKNGTLYIHNKNGTFYLLIISAVQNYTLIIEQDLTTVPEFPSWTPLLIMIVAVVAITAIYRRRLPKSNKRGGNQ